MWDNKNESSVWIWTDTGNVQCGYGGERSETMEQTLLHSRGEVYGDVDVYLVEVRR